jgi:hypothetical protein
MKSSRGLLTMCEAWLVVIMSHIEIQNKILTLSIKAREGIILNYIVELEEIGLCTCEMD